jgi:porphobilinogen synthase
MNSVPSVFGQFPRSRLRRTRQSDWLRQLVAETDLLASDLIWPVFVVDGENRQEPIARMPGVKRYSADVLESEIESALKLGIVAIAIFPHIPYDQRSADARAALDPDNLVCRVVRRVKSSFPQLGIITDVALDPFNSLGHDGLVRDGQILNDETVELLCQQAVIQAAAGSDVLAPSDMMDGRIGAIRERLDCASFAHVPLMSYAAKFASALYQPFREAIGSASLLKGDKRTYQLPPGNANEALREVAQDIEEGADMLIVKPGIAYLDVLYRVSHAFGVPTFAYQVSGEYAMLKAAEQAAIIDYPVALLELLLAFKRAGACGILTYAALDAARLLHMTAVS